MAKATATEEGQSRRYQMTVAGQLFNHLGLQMYSGAVPAIAELISNPLYSAWGDEVAANVA